jgi:hypothetical protein
MKIHTIGLRIARAPGVGGSVQSSGPTSRGPRSGQFRSAIGPHSRPIGTAESHATGRQRSDGSRPLGNSSGRNVNSTGKPPAHTQVVSQAAKAPPGTEPGAVHRAYTANSLAKVTSPWDSPMVQKIQPSRCRGRRTATTAPTRENKDQGHRSGQVHQLPRRAVVPGGEDDCRAGQGEADQAQKKSKPRRRSTPLAAVDLDSAVDPHPPTWWI